MRRTDLAFNSRIQEATVQVLEEAKEGGRLETVLDEDHIIQTLHAVIRHSEIPVSTYRQQKFAETAAAERIGQYAQDHHLI